MEESLYRKSRPPPLFKEDCSSLTVVTGFFTISLFADRYMVSECTLQDFKTTK